MMMIIIIIIIIIIIVIIITIFIIIVNLETLYIVQVHPSKILQFMFLLLYHHNLCLTLYLPHFESQYLVHLQILI